MTTDATLARGNTVLGGLDETSLAALLPDLTDIALPNGRVLHEPGRPITEVYFPLLGVVSVVADLGDDQIVETATIGREGLVGVSVYLGATAPTERALVQVPGRALCMSAEDLREHITDVNGPLTAMLRRSAQVLFTQVARNPACNRVHTIRRRAARWLLMTADRMDGPSFELTQHFLAQMLAVRRTSVSEVARSLAEDGCITYTRGLITITDRPRLQAHACDCYEAIRRATNAAMGHVSPTARATPTPSVRRSRVSEQRIGAVSAHLRGPQARTRGRTPPVPGQLAGIGRHHDGTE